MASIQRSGRSGRVAPSRCGALQPGRIAARNRRGPGRTGGRTFAQPLDCQPQKENPRNLESILTAGPQVAGLHLGLQFFSYVLTSSPQIQTLKNENLNSGRAMAALFCGDGNSHQALWAIPGGWRGGWRGVQKPAIDHGQQEEKCESDDQATYHRVQEQGGGYRR